MLEEGRPERVKARCRCPKCRSRDLTACEITEASMLFQIRGGRMSKIWNSEDYGGVIGVELTCCRCKHHWKPRGVIQITDLLVSQ